MKHKVMGLSLAISDTIEKCDVRKLYGNRIPNTRMARRLRTGVEPIWFDIMSCAPFYSDLMSIPEVSRMFQRNLEYSSIFYNRT